MTTFQSYLYMIPFAMNEKKITAYLVDDNPSDLMLLEYHLNKHCESIKMVGNASTVSKAIKDINELQPQILFLDINLKNEDSFQIIDGLEEIPFEIIFITSHSEHAVKAFSYEARDFIVKPFEASRLLIAVSRAINQIELREKKHSNVAISTQMHKLDIPLLAVPTLDRIVFLDIEEIIYCEADGRYTTFYLTSEKPIVASRNLGEYENLLPNNFFRIHHKYLVNLFMVKAIDKSGGNYCEMKYTPKQLPIAKRRQESLSRYLKLKS